MDGLEWVRGPYPVKNGDTLPTTDETRRAVRRAQAALGLAVDGELGPQTWAAIAATNEPPPARACWRRPRRR